MTRFENFTKELQKSTPQLQIKFKNESFLMKLLGWVLYLINPKFSTTYTTTIGSTIYFPNREFIDKFPHQSLTILAHEYLHIQDTKRLGKFVFSCLYLFPLILLPLIPLVWLFFNWLYATIFLVVCSLPWPAWGRKYLELRAYQMSLFMLYVLGMENGMVLEVEKTIDRINTNFTTSMYYWMWPFGVKNSLRDFYHTKLNTMASSDVIYKEILSALEKSKSI